MIFILDIKMGKIELKFWLKSELEQIDGPCKQSEIITSFLFTPDLF